MTNKKDQKDNDQNQQWKHALETNDKSAFVQFIQKNNKKINELTYRGQPLIHHAIDRNWFDLIEPLVQAGCDLTQESTIGDCALFKAIKQLNLSLVQQLLNLDKRLLQANHYGMTPLKLALQMMASPIVKELIQQGAEVNPTVKVFEFRPISYAMDQEKMTCLKLLIKQGALLIDEKERWSALTESIHYNPLATKILIENKVPLNFINHSGLTAVMEAARFNQLDHLKILIEAGADLLLRNDSNKMALHFAAQKGNIESAELLLKAGVQINAEKEYPFLLEAMAYDQKEMVLFLIQKGADASIRTPSNETYLQVAIKMTSDDLDSESLQNIMEYLLPWVDINAEDDNGETALWLAVMKQNLKIIQWLVDHGADLDKKYANNETVLELAQKLENPTITEYIRAAQDCKKMGQITLKKETLSSLSSKKENRLRL